MVRAASASSAFSSMRATAARSRSEARSRLSPSRLSKELACACSAKDIAPVGRDCRGYANSARGRNPRYYVDYAAVSVPLEIGLSGLPEEKGKVIGGLAPALLLGGAYAVTGVVVEVEQDRLAGGRGGAEPCRHLRRMPVVDSRIVHAVHEHHGRVGDTLLHVVVAAHGEECAEFVFLRHRAELRDVRYAVGGRLGADHVKRADDWHDRREKIRALGHRPADEDAARAAAHDAKPRARRVLLRDQVFRGGDEVLPGVGLRRLVARLVPVVAVDAAAANVRPRVDAAALEPREPRRRVVRLLGKAVRAVAVEQRRIGAVELDVGAMDDGGGDLAAVVPRPFTSVTTRPSGASNGPSGCS